MQIAIYGCGQLARMMALAGWSMDLQFSFLAEANENTDCVTGLGSVIRRQPGLNGSKLYEALGKPQVLTVEREDVDIELLESLRPFCSVYPDPQAIAISQHRGREKTTLQSLGIPVAPFRLADSVSGIKDAIEHLGYPVFIKSCEQGYDGQNQWQVSNQEQLATLFAEQSYFPEVVVEKKVNFDCEVSLLAVRNPQDQCAFYPLTRNEHKDGILISSFAPADDLPVDIFIRAKEIASILLRELQYVGVLAIEFFIVEGRLLVNEIAPRVHNSGHWTQAGDVCSQFENHLRAIIGLGLGKTEVAGYAGMLNLLGQRASQEIIGQENVQFNWYQKSLRPRRKVGHLNLHNSHREKLLLQMKEIENQLYCEEQPL